MANCSHSDLTQIPKSLPKDTDWLILNGNNISSPEITEIMHIQSLFRLDLKDNKMELIPEDFIEYLTKHKSLDDLDISNNNLKMIPMNFGKIKVEKLRLSGNRFECKCNNMWMKNFLIDSREMILDYNTVDCQLKSGKSIPFILLSDTHLTCPSMFVHSTKIMFIFLSNKLKLNL